MARHPPPKDTSINIACSHSLSSKNFLIWRVIVCIYFWIVFLWSQIQYTIWNGYFGKTFIYLTIWTLILCTIYMTLSLHVSFIHYQYTNSGPNNLEEIGHPHCSRYCRYTKKIQCLATTISVTVVVAFWSLLWQFADMSDPINAQVHGTTMVLTIIDFYLCYSIISFKSTFWYVLAFGAIYIIWSIIYQLIADEAIYPVLDWTNDPLASLIVSVVVAVVSVLIHLFLCWSNGKLLSKLGYQHGDGAPFIALSESIHAAEISQDQGVHDEKNTGANTSLASYGTQAEKNSVFATTNE